MGQSSEKIVKLEPQFSSPHEVMVCDFPGIDTWQLMEYCHQGASSKPKYPVFYLSSVSICLCGWALVSSSSESQANPVITSSSRIQPDTT